jgi:hypothetical protein
MGHGPSRCGNKSRERRTSNRWIHHQTVLGFCVCLKRWGLDDEANIRRKLKWQNDVGGDSQKIKQFQGVVGALQDFKTYLLLKPGSVFVTVVHSPMRFVAINEETQHLKGRFIGFVGDRSITKDPTLILLPQQKTWHWETCSICTDSKAVTMFYREDTLH